MEAYFAIEVTTAATSRAVRRRDIGRFLAFVLSEEFLDLTRRFQQNFAPKSPFDPQE